MRFPCPTKTYHTQPYAAIDPTLPQLSTRGKNVVITGGGSGIGASIAIAFAKSGASNIALLGRTEATLSKTKRQIEGNHPSTIVSTYVADVVDAAALKRALDDFATKTGKIHILIANAGVLHTLLPIASSDPEEWWHGYEVNVKGNFNLIRAFLPHADSGAAIVNISAGIAHTYLPGYSGYATSKLAAAHLFEYLSKEHPNFFVLSVHPGIVDTGMTTTSLAGRPPPVFDDIDLGANFTVWSVSSEARFLNGKLVWANWDVDELKAMKQQIEETDKFTLGLLGWAQ